MFGTSGTRPSGITKTPAAISTGSPWTIGAGGCSFSDMRSPSAGARPDDRTRRGSTGRYNRGVSVEIAGRPLEGRIALITGAGRSIGAAIARRLAADGARVLVGDADPSSAAGVARSIGDRAEGVASTCARARRSSRR